MMYPGSNHQSRNNSGFTIVELLIVVVVIAILAAITIVAYNGISDRAKQSALASKTASAGKKIATNAISNNETFSDYSTFAASGIVDQTADTFRYTVSPDKKSYCLTLIDGKNAFTVSSDNTSAVSGRCPEHAQTTITNLVLNPNLTVNPTGYGRSGTATSTTSWTSTGGLFGNEHLRANFSSTGAGGIYYGTTQASRPDVTAGQTYTVSAYLKSTIPISIIPKITWYTSSATAITPDVSGETVTIDSTWKRVVVSGTAPASAIKAMLTFYNYDSSWTSGAIMNLDGLMMTQGSEVHSFADGSSPGWSWTVPGSPNASTSTGLSL